MLRRPGPLRAFTQRVCGYARGLAMDEKSGGGSASGRGYVLPAAPENAASLSPEKARDLFRLGTYRGPTAGFCAGYLQANITVLPTSMAGEFGEFCRRNHAAMPVVYLSKPGEVSTSLTSTNSDIRTDIPRYCVYSEGRVVEDTSDLLGFSLEEFTSFYSGCSFSWESALLEAGLELRNLSLGKLVPMYQTNIATYAVGGFSGPMTVTMRPFPEAELGRVVEITAQYPDLHGAPVHIGDPARIGVDLGRVHKGEVLEVKSGEVPVFWACSFTNATALANAKPEMAFTHYPGCMFITDQPAASKPLRSSPRVIRLSREGAPFFASVLGEEVGKLFPRLEQALLDDPTNTGVTQFFQESDLLRATLALSHSSTVAITTGFPRLPDYEVKEGTDGLPGALAVAQALLQLGKQVSLIVDRSNATLFNLIADYMTSIGGLSSKIPVLLLESVRENMAGNGGEGQNGRLFDCLVAVGRVGKNRNGAYLSKEGGDVSDCVDPIDSLFEEALVDPSVTTIAVGSSVNEVGMGKVRGEQETGCVVASDCLVASGVGNWAGHALAAGLYAVSRCPLHWRYRNQGVNAETPPNLDINDFVNSERFTSMLQYMNQVGVRDGVTGSPDQSVGGAPLSVHLNKMQELRDVVLEVS